MSISNWKILYKLLALVGIMSLVIAVVAVIGIHGIRTLDAETDEVAAAGGDSAIGERIQQHVLGLNRSEFRLAADPSPQSLASLVGEIDERRGAIKSEIEDAKQTADDTQLQKLNATSDALTIYLTELDKMLAKAKALKDDSNIGTERQQLIQTALDSRDEADKLGGAAQEYAKVSKSEMDEEVDAAASLGDDLQFMMAATAVVGVLGGLLSGYLLASFAIAKPITAAVGRLETLADGDTDAPINGQGRKDEIGAMAKTMEVFRANLIRNREMQERELAEQVARAARAKKIEDLTEGFDRAASVALKTVSSAATQLQSTASSMTQIAEETARQATVVASASEETTANVQTVASATEELSASIHEISGRVVESSRIVDSAVTQAHETNGKVGSLSEAASKIGEIVYIITEIAAQTNLLALNATIEAARAGEAGKGFAVVASEVKTLATQTARATDEIASQIRAIQSATSSSAEAIKEIGVTINRVSEISTTIASAVEEQGAATQEISRNVQQAAQGTQEVSQNIISVTTAAEHTGTAAAEVLEASGELAKQAVLLREEVEKYIHGVRAA